jgi:phosphate transport system protein
MTMPRNTYTIEMERIRADVLEMSLRVEEDLRKAVLALKNRDVDLAEWVKLDDRTVNAMQLALQDRASVLMATQQPVARDLRELVSTIRLADNLERMGDYTVHLAKTVIKLKDADWPRQFAILGEMGEAGCRMIRAMTDAYLTFDADAASACAKTDVTVDDLHHELMALTLSGVKEKPAKAEEAIKLIRTSGFLERLADHVTNSCELVMYVATGAHVEFND